MAANTPHLVFDEVQARSPIPMLSIVQAACDHARGLGFRRFGLLGTGFTMRARFFPDVFARAGLELVAPRADEQAIIHDKYINELLKNQFLPETRAALLGMIERMRATTGSKRSCSPEPSCRSFSAAPSRKGSPSSTRL